MSDIKSWIGLDVHIKSTEASSFDVLTGELKQKRLPGKTEKIASYVDRLQKPAKVVYEAGPMGFVLARALNELEGVECVVCAPSLIPKAPSDRVKTDKRDAKRLGRLFMAGELTAVRVPTKEEEAIRDLVRAREDLRRDLNRARRRLQTLLLRHGIRYEEGKSWTDQHGRWLSKVEFDNPALKVTFRDYLGAVDALAVRRQGINDCLVSLVDSSPWSETVARLRTLRGVDTLTAIGLCTEIGDFNRFDHPKQLMKYVGLVPSEYSSGDKRIQGAITKTGSQHARRLLVEAAWQYRRKPWVGKGLADRQKGQDPEAIAISWKAQQRLSSQWNHLDRKRGKLKTVVATAVARELTGFVWAVARVP